MANETILQTSKSRFDISNDGWKRMNAGRSPSELIREAVANAFDADDVTEVRVRFENGLIVIEDNSPTGVSDPNLITTIFLTGKSDTHTKRGRKGRGLKELIAAAEFATIETVGHTIEFTEGRVVKKNDRKTGTKVSVYAPQWTADDIRDAFGYLLKFIPPPRIKFFVMSQQIEPRHVSTVFSSYLETQIIDDGVQKSSYKMSDVHVVELSASDDSGWIYEMGIPIQKIDTNFHIDVQQRVPLNDNRNNVDTWYLEGLYAEILNVTVVNMVPSQLKEKWVSTALSRVKQETKKVFVEKVFGEAKGIAIKSKNKKANDLVKQHGLEVLDTTGMPTQIESAVRSVVNTADVVADHIEKSSEDVPVDPMLADPDRHMVRLTRYLGLQLLSMDLDVQFIDRAESITGHLRRADFNKETKTIRFNVKANIKPMTADYFGLICHEFAHAQFHEHDDQFRREVERLSGKLAMLMLTRYDDVLTLMGQKQTPVPPGKVRINCDTCATPRDIYPHDAHQVKKCAPCTKRARTARATMRRAEKRQE